MLRQIPFDRRDVEDRPPAYLVVFEARRAALVTLPACGELVIGSAESAAIRIADPEAAAEQARIVVTHDDLTIESLPGANGTAVNGEILAGRRSLVSADVVVIGRATVVFHGRPRRTQREELLSFGELRRRLRQEIERSSRYGHAVSVFVVDLGPERTASADEICCAAIDAVRFVDIVGFNGASELAIVFPETSEAAEIPAQRVLKALGGLVPGSRGGLARCPADGVDADSLVAGARAACRVAAPGTVSAVWKRSPAVSAGEHEIVVADARMLDLYETVRDLAQSDIPVLILGETGVGKELVARALHEWSPRRKAKLVVINCASVAESLLESELFGHERGAFTGAERDKVGLLESASGGTVFLDEIGESSLHAQAGLLRALETKLVRRIGALSERPIDVRIIAASNRRLEDEASADGFRRDLFFRLSAAKIVVPPLRERPLDIPVLVRRFAESGCAVRGRPVLSVSPEAMRQLQLYRWPGNVRELKNLMEYLASVVREPAIEVEHLPDGMRTVLPWQKTTSSRQTAPTAFERPQFSSLAEEIQDLERRRIAEALLVEDGVRIRTAAALGMPLRTLLTKMKAYGLDTTPSSRRRSRRNDRA